MSPSLYEALGVAATASGDEIRSAYREACLRLHPDKASGQGMHPELAVVAFRDVQRAWEVLRDPQLRAVHDRELALAELRSVLSFQDELEVDEMELHGGDGSDAGPSYSFDCRCGEVYCLSVRELEAVQEEIAVPCVSCSNHILVRAPRRGDGAGGGSPAAAGTGSIGGGLDVI